MDKKLSSKFDALQGLPSGLARQMILGEVRSKASVKFQEATKAKRQRVETALAAASKKTGAFKSKRGQDGVALIAEAHPEGDGPVPDDIDPASVITELKTEEELGILTAAQKVKAWREANPEAYAKQKREFAERRAAKKRAEKETK